MTHNNKQTKYIFCFKKLTFFYHDIGIKFKKKTSILKTVIFLCVNKYSNTYKY